MVDDICQRSPAPCGEPPDPLAWFSGMIDHCYDFAESARAQGRPIVGIMCEFTPREIILAAGAVPVCLCGGSAATIPAAEQLLPANLCPLIKSTFGYHLTGKNPFLNWADLVVAETTCDGKKKMFELLGRFQTDVCPRTAAESRGTRRARTLGARTAQVPAIPGPPFRGGDHRPPVAPGHRTDEP